MKQTKLWAGRIVLSLLFFLMNNLSSQQMQQLESSSRSNRFGWKGPEVGTVIKDFELPALNGETFRLSDHLGKIIVFEFGACT
jgi:hypothetical protein